MSLETPQNKLCCSHLIALGQQSKSKSISTLYNKRSDGGILVGVCYHDYGWVSDKLFRVCSRLSKKSFVRFDVARDLSRLRGLLGRFAALKARSALFKTSEVDLWQV